MTGMANEFAERYQGRRADSTVVQYRQAAANFDKYLKVHGRNIKSLISLDLDNYVRWMIAEGYKATSVNNYLGIARMYIEWCAKAGIDVPEMAKPMLPRVKKPKIEILPEKLIPTYNAACLRYLLDPFQTALLLLPMSGLRVSEMCTLESKDIEIFSPSEETPFGAAQLHVVGKGGKYRRVPLLSDGLPVLANYVVNTRKTLPRNRWLFPATKSTKAGDGHITRKQISNRLNTIKKKLKISNLHPHLLRHTYGTILNESGVEGFDLAEIMGHSDVRVTSIYVHPVHSRLLNEVSQLSYKRKK